MSLQLSQIDEAEPTADVLIVGSGPAGLFAACEFVRHGVKPRVVERRLAPHHEARGTALQPATLDIINRAGLIEPFFARAYASGKFSCSDRVCRKSRPRNLLVSGASMNFSAASRSGRPKPFCAIICRA